MIQELQKNEAFKQTDLSNRNYLSVDQFISTAKCESTDLTSGPNGHWFLGTIYRRDYVKFGDSICKLKKRLNRRGMIHLVI